MSRNSAGTLMVSSPEQRHTSRQIPGFFGIMKIRRSLSVERCKGKVLPITGHEGPEGE